MLSYIVTNMRKGTDDVLRMASYKVIARRHAKGWRVTAAYLDDGTHGFYEATEEYFVEAMQRLTPLIDAHEAEHRDKGKPIRAGSGPLDAVHASLSEHQAHRRNLMLLMQHELTDGS